MGMIRDLRGGLKGQGRLVGIGHDAPHRPLKRREVDGDDFPEDILINSEILVPEAVAEAGNLAPRNFRVTLNQIGGKVLHGLADDLERVVAGKPKVPVV